MRFSSNGSVCVAIKWIEWAINRHYILKWQLWSLCACIYVNIQWVIRINSNDVEETEKKTFGYCCVVQNTLVDEWPNYGLCQTVPVEWPLMEENLIALLLGGNFVWQTSNWLNDVWRHIYNTKHHFTPLKVHSAWEMRKKLSKYRGGSEIFRSSRKIRIVVDTNNVNTWHLAWFSLKIRSFVRAFHVYISIVTSSHIKPAINDHLPAKCLGFILWTCQIESRRLVVLYPVS